MENSLDFSRSEVEVGKSSLRVGGLLAPTIRYHKGTFYILCTNCVRGEAKIFKNFIISTKDIASNLWSKPVYFDFDGFDPSLFFDDDGNVYVQGAFVLGYQGQPSTTIKQFCIDLTTGKALSEQKVIWEGFTKVAIEGPHMHKKDGFYYLVAAEGGTFDGHMVSVARSKDSVWGPFESYSQNPILKAKDLNQTVQHTGHADIFQSNEGSWFSVFLGIRNNNGRYPLGRETFITRVSWPEGDFPRMEEITGIMSKDETPIESQVHFAHSDLYDSLSTLYIRNPNLDAFRIEPSSKLVELTSSQVKLDDPNYSPCFLGCRQRFLTGEVTVQLENLSSTLAGSEAGLAVYKDECRYAYISFDSNTNSVKFVVHHSIAQDMNKVFEEKVGTIQSMTFKIVTTDNKYKFEYSLNDQDSYQILGEIDTKVFTWYDFTGTVFGVFAYGNGHKVQFRNFAANATVMG